MKFKTEPHLDGLDWYARKRFWHAWHGPWVSKAAAENAANGGNRLAVALEMGTRAGSVLVEEQTGCYTCVGATDDD